MTETPKVSRPRIREGLFSAISLGLFFLLVGVIFIMTPNLFEDVQTFFNDFESKAVPHFTNVFLPAPAHPAAHSTVYTAVWQFSLVWALFQIVALAVRFAVGSPIGKKAETAGNVVFWVGTTYLVGLLLNNTTHIEEWFAFWAAIIMLIGISLIVRAVVLAARLAVS